jgi:glycosyltransferase involved in cell wall biosynthesis
LGLSSNEVLALFVGRDTAKKNFDALLTIPRRGFRLVVCGATRAIAMPSVTDLGIVPHSQMPDVYACADLMVLPSTGEGFPLAAQEAMASGVPLVLQWDDGYGRWLDKGVVAACDTTGDLSAQVQHLASDPTVRAKLAAAARDWAVRFWSWEQTVAQYERLYYELADATRLVPSSGDGGHAAYG